jgi:hypothetical protein
VCVTITLQDYNGLFLFLEFLGYSTDGLNFQPYVSFEKNNFFKSIFRRFGLYEKNY